jgi:hypothetical protein
MMRILIGTLALLAALVRPALAATDVWLFYGWGPNGWSSGIDQIARRVRTLAGVNHVTVLDYRDTQRAYDEALMSPPEHALAFVGYSCGGNAALVVGGSLAHNNRTTYVITLQPSEWCGRYPTTANMRYFQNTWSSGTWGLGSYQPDGDAQHVISIERSSPHGAADTDPIYQRDAVLAVAAVASPSRRHWLTNWLGRSTRFVRSNGQTIWLEGE